MWVDFLTFFDRSWCRLIFVNHGKSYIQRQTKIAGRWQDMGSELFAVTDRTNKTSCLSPVSI